MKDCLFVIYIIVETSILPVASCTVNLESGELNTQRFVGESIDV